MSEPSNISHICGRSNAVLDVVFVHGLTGTPLETWTVGGEYWPKWLCNDLPGVGVYAIGYPAGLFEKWAKKEMNLHERAGNILEHLAGYGFGERPLAFISHSLGGILVKEILRASKESTDEDLGRIAQNTRLAVFLATPHTGASLAAIMKFAVPRLASNFIDLLSNDAGYLTSLNWDCPGLVNTENAFA
jgi:alpha-beta hydrolase superfamily lysophospholipase